MRTSIPRYILAALLLSSAANVWAASASALMQVSAQVVPNCRISVGDLAFGSYDPLLENASRELDATADVTLLCTKNAQLSIVFDHGRNGTPSTRALTGGSERVNYDLFRDAARTQRWADGENALRITGAGGRDAQQFSVFGRIPPGQEVPPGPYQDVVTATVDF